MFSKKNTQSQQPSDGSSSYTNTLTSSYDEDPVIADILKKIEREQNIAKGASNLRKKTSNSMVINKCNISIREAQMNIEYLEQTLTKLKLQKDSDNGHHHHHRHRHHGSDQNNEDGDNDAASSSSSSSNTTVVRAQTPTFTVLDLLKYECPSLGHRIQYMLQQLEFKIQVEEQYKEANEKIYKLYQMEGDRGSTAAAAGGRIDGDRRIQLMKKSLKLYQSMYVDIDDVAKDTAVMNTFRKPSLSGLLTINVTAIRNVDHMASPFLSKHPETTVSLKIDDVEKVRTKPSRNDRWNEEYNINVEHANEVGITVFDKSGDQLYPVGLIWLPLSDIAEEMRRLRVNNEKLNNDWISASNIVNNKNENNNSSNGNSFGNNNNHDNNFANDTISGNGASRGFQNNNGETPYSATNFKSTSWYELEPSGQILLTLGFTKSNENMKSANKFAGGLGRHGAIRQRKEEVIEHHGHKFVQKQFYSIMSCAVCNDFLRYSGLQCEDCKFLCHKKCYANVINKCISTSSTDLSPGETKLNHRIPHRFEVVANRGTKWCCHCGYILPWSRTKVRKCSECGIMCHAQCSHLVPDFCGMSIETASQILKAIKYTQERQQQQKQQNTIAAAKNQTARPLIKNDPNTSSDSIAYPTPQRAATKRRPPPTMDPRQQQQQQQNQELPPLPSNYQQQPGQQQVQNNHAYPDSAVATQQTSNVPSNAAQQEYARQKQEQLKLQQQEQLKQQEMLRLEEHKQRELEQFRQQQQQQQQAQQQQQIQPQSPQELSHRLPDNGLSLTTTNDSSKIHAEVPQQHHTNNSHSYAQVHSQHRSSGKSRRHRHRYGLDDFNFLAVLGKGNFGKVMLAESVHNQELCAIKVLKKDFIIQNDEVESTKSEKRVFLIANRGVHPFLLNLHQCFQTENRIYFVMEYISGGDLMWHVQKERFSLRRAQFYAAEVLLALSFLHENGVVYRDLKLDNILLTTDGHIKLADYGLCKEDMWYGNSTGTFCGTPELMAPEIIQEKKYDKAVDWWAFGVLLYQMLLTKSPFRGEDEDEIFNAILTDEPLYPIHMAKEAVDILQRLLTRDPTQRLGSSKRDGLDIMEHPYFANINFDDILACKVTPPYVPDVRDPRDISCFDEEFTSQAPKLTPVNSMLSPSMQEMFRGFTYVSDDKML